MGVLRVPTGRMCEWVDLPPCDSVLALGAEQPLVTHEQDDILPICLRTLRSSTEQFVKRNYGSSEVIDRWASQWPLPVGAQSLRDWFRAALQFRLTSSLPPEVQYRLSFVRPPELLPGEVSEAPWVQVLDAQLDRSRRDALQRHPPAFLTERQRQRLASLRVEELPPPLAINDEAQAGLIVERRLPGGRVFLLGLMEKGSGGELVFTAPVTRQTDGQYLLAAESKKLTDWYKVYLWGRQIRGRTIGTTDVEIDELRRVYRDTGDRAQVELLAKQQPWYVERGKTIVELRAVANVTRQESRRRGKLNWQSEYDRNIAQVRDMENEARDKLRERVRYACKEKETSE
jgi:hypothetical protein